MAGCLWCGAPMAPSKPNRRYCSRVCCGRAKTKGGLSLRDGRWRVRTRNGGWQLFSRCVMEAELERHLSYDEIVHHVNEDPTDDRIENLEVVSRQDHIAIHRDVVTHRGRLTTEQVEQILTTNTSAAVLAERFGVTDGAIYYRRKQSILKSQGRA